VDFRYNIFGGKPRLILEDHTVLSNKAINPELKGIVKRCFELYFKNIPADWSDSGQKLLLHSLSLNEKKQKDKEITLTNFFFSVLEDRYTGNLTKTYSSTFLGLVAADLMETSESTLIKTLQNVLGSSGIGNAREYCFHRSMLRHQRTHFDGISEQYDIISFDIVGITVKLIQTIEDIQEIGEGEYGLPTIPNFPVVDAIAKINGDYYCFQVTVGDHDVAETSTLMLGLLQKNLGTGRIFFIWVLEKEKLVGFPFSRVLTEEIIQMKVFTDSSAKTVLQAKLVRGISLFYILFPHFLF
jgi:hypothetical protein